MQFFLVKITMFATSCSSICTVVHRRHFVVPLPHSAALRVPYPHTLTNQIRTFGHNIPTPISHFLQHQIRTFCRTTVAKRGAVVKRGTVIKWGIMSKRRRVQLQNGVQLQSRGKSEVVTLTISWWTQCLRTLLLDSRIRFLK